MKIFFYEDGEGQKKGGLFFLEEALGRAFPEKKIRLFKDDRGKPVTDEPGVFVSVSHCGKGVACAVSDRPVGIDLEERNRPVRADKIAGRFFTDEERALVKKGGDGAFLEIWVRKEAWSKLEGRGLSYGIDKIQTARIRKGEAVLMDKIKGVPLVSGVRGGLVYSIAGEGSIEWTEVQL